MHRWARVSALLGGVQCRDSPFSYELFRAYAPALSSPLEYSRGLTLLATSHKSTIGTRCDAPPLASGAAKSRIQQGSPSSSVTDGGGIPAEVATEEVSLEVIQEALEEIKRVCPTLLTERW